MGVWEVEVVAEVIMFLVDSKCLDGYNSRWTPPQASLQDISLSHTAFLTLTTWLLQLKRLPWILVYGWLLSTMPLLFSSFL
jgi:hypothetical protein